MKFDPARGKRIKALREEVGITQADLMTRIEVRSEKTIQRWEKGQPIQANNLSALAEAVGATVETILGLPEQEPLTDPLQNHEARIAELEATVKRIFQLIDERPAPDLATQDAERDRLAQEGRPDARQAGKARRGRGRSA